MCYNYLSGGDSPPNRINRRKENRIEENRRKENRILT